MHCFIFGCPNGCDGPKDQKKARMVQIFFTAPEDESLFRQWQLIIPRSSNKIFSRGDKLCDLHFKKSEVVLFNETKLPNGNVRRVPALEPKLKAGTIPSIFPKGCKNESETDKNKEPKATTVSEAQKSRGKRKLSSDDLELPETPTSRPRGRPRKVISEGNKEKPTTPAPEKRKKIDPDVESLEAIEEKQYKEIDSDDDSNEELTQAGQPSIRLVPLESLLDPTQTKDEQAKGSKRNKKRKQPSPSQSPPPAVKKKKVTEVKSSPIKPSESRKKVRENIEEVCAELELAVTDISEDEGAYEIEHTIDIGDEGADLFEIGSIKNGSDDVDQKKTLEELAAELGETDDPELLNLPGSSSGSPLKPRITQVISLCGMDDEGNLVQHNAKVDSVELEMAKILGEDVEPSCSSDIPIPLKTNESGQEDKPEKEHNTLGDSEETITKSNSTADEHPPSECSTGDRQIPAKKNLNEEITNSELNTLDKEKSKIPGDVIEEIPEEEINKMEREAEKPEKDADEVKSEADKVKRDTEKSKIDIETDKGKTEIDSDKVAIESKNDISARDAEVETGKAKIDENKAETETRHVETELETNIASTETATDKLEEEKEAGTEKTFDKLGEIKEAAKDETQADKVEPEVKYDEVEPIEESVKAGKETETGKKETETKSDTAEPTKEADKVQQIKETANAEIKTDKKETETKSDTMEPIKEADKAEPIKEVAKAEIETERKSDNVEQIKEAAEAETKADKKEIEAKSDKEEIKEAVEAESIKDVAKAETEADKKETETKVDKTVTDSLESNDIQLESTALKENVPEAQSPTEETFEETNVLCPGHEAESNPDEDGSHPSGDSLSKKIRSDSVIKENSFDKNETVKEDSDNVIRNEREENDVEEVEVHSSGSSVILDLSSDSEADPTWAPGPDTIVLSDENDTDPGSNNEESPTTDDRRKSISPNKSKGKGKKQGPPPTVEQVAKILHPDALKQILSNLTFPLNGPVALSIADGSTLTGATRIIPKGSILQNENSPSKFRTRKVQISGERGKKCAKLLGLKMFEGLGKIKKAFDFSTFISDPDDELQFKKFCLLVKECLKDVCESKNAVTNIGKLTIKISHKTLKNESNALSQALKNAEIISHNESLQDHNESQSLPQVDPDAHKQSASTIKDVHHDNTDEAEMFECMTVDSNVENHYESGPSIENAMEEQTAA